MLKRGILYKSTFLPLYKTVKIQEYKITMIKQNNFFLVLYALTSYVFSRLFYKTILYILTWLPSLI